MIAVEISTGCAFLEFCSIVLYMLIKQCVPLHICTNKPADEDDYEPLDAIDIN